MVLLSKRKSRWWSLEYKNEAVRSGFHSSWRQGNSKATDPENWFKAELAVAVKAKTLGQKNRVPTDEPLKVMLACSFLRIVPTRS